MSESSKQSDPPVEITDPKQLTTIYKKNGSFDKQRKILLENFKQSETHANLLLKLKLMVESKVRQDPSILMKNRGKMGALIQGEIINEHLSKGESGGASGGGLLSIVDKDIQDKIVDSPEFNRVLKTELKDIRRVLLGISDEDYAKQLADEEAREVELKQAKQRELQAAPLSGSVDYKSSSYRSKGIGGNHRITKPPRFNFSNSRHRDNDRDTQGGAGGSTGSGNSGDGTNNGKSVPFLMY